MASTSSSITSMMAFPRSLRRIPVPLGRKPMRLKVPEYKHGSGRLIALRNVVTDLFRDERIQIPQYKAFESRAYAERLIQIAIEYGDKHRPTMELCDFWLQEKDLIHKLFKVLVPRFQYTMSAYTRIYVLPVEYTMYYGRMISVKWNILELKGNPYPPVVPKPENHRNSLLNVLLDTARKNQELRPNKPDSVSVK